MTVEVGTNSYGNETGLQAYADERGITLSATTEAEKTVLLIKAMDANESRLYKGERYLWTQDLQFPRTWYDYANGDEAGVTPDRIIKAQYETAVLIDTGEVFNDKIERATKKEKVDVIEVEYMDNASSTTNYPSVEMLLRDYLKSSGTHFKVSNG